LRLQGPAARRINPDEVAAKAVGYDKASFEPNFNETIGRIAGWKLGLLPDLPIGIKTNQVLVLS